MRPPKAAAFRSSIPRWRRRDWTSRLRGLDAGLQIHRSPEVPVLSVPLARRLSDLPAGSMSRTSTLATNDIVAGPIFHVTVPLKRPSSRRSVIFAPGMHRRPPLCSAENSQATSAGPGMGNDTLELQTFTFAASARWSSACRPQCLHCCQTRNAVCGISMCVTPRCRKGIDKPHSKAGMPPTCGDSATPLAPIGWCGEGVTV